MRRVPEKVSLRTFIVVKITSWSEVQCTIVRYGAIIYGYTLTKIKLNEPGNSTFMGLHRKCHVKWAKYRRWGNYLFTGQGCLVECMAHTYKEFQQGKYQLKNKTLYATAISWHFLKLTKTIFNGILTPKHMYCFIQQDNASPDQSGKGKKLSQSGMPMVFQNFFVRVS